MNTLEGELKGKKFKYNSPYNGLSSWTATVKSLSFQHQYVYDESIIGKLRSKKIGYTIEVIVFSEESIVHYSLNEIVILDEKE